MKDLDIDSLKAEKLQLANGMSLWAIKSGDSLVWIDPFYADDDVGAIAKFVNEMTRENMNLKSDIQTIEIIADQNSHLMKLAIYVPGKNGKDKKAFTFPISVYGGKEYTSIRIKIINGKIYFLDRDE
jgi:hypothetical protein